MLLLKQGFCPSLSDTELQLTKLIPEWLKHFYFVFQELEDIQFKQLAPVVRKMNNSIHQINHYPADSVVCFVNTYPLDSDLSGE